MNNFPHKLIIISSSMDYFLSFLISILIVLCSVFWLWRSISKTKILEKKQAAPKAGSAWPLIGHLHLLGGPEPAHKVLGKMADKYGPVFIIKMGLHPNLVVSNWEIAKECLNTNDKAFANRPKILAMELLGYDRSMIGFIPYGNYWREIRKISTLELLSNQRLDTFRHVRELEVTTALKELYKFWDTNKTKTSSKVEVEMKRWFGDITLNLVLRIIVGKSVGYVTTNERDSERWKQALRDFFDLAGRFIAADAVPFLRWLDIGGHEKAMKKTAKELDVVVEEWLKEHKMKKSSGEDFMDLMLNIIDQDMQEALGRDSDTITKATSLALILAGSDTSTVTLTWALSLLINNPHVLRKAQQELEFHVGKYRVVNESDVNNLVYLKAIVKETLRLYPAGPLSIPHESMEDCTVGDYHIPSGTRLLINIWKIQRDPRVWSDPCEFRPERFLTTHKTIDVRGQNFEFIPFSSGRRMCPGISFALQMLHLALATLLHGFDFGSLTSEPIDMTESIGMTNPRATPLQVLINPRLPLHLYQEP
uniref:Cytochrome p450 n=1 Tax=Croton stellatopilosus TaxID=431156 RepID=A0A3G2CJT9_9ROSI|nr:cytochrome p450 [Croton stellatopilosus]